MVEAQDPDSGEGEETLEAWDLEEYEDLPPMLKRMLEKESR